MAYFIHYYSNLTAVLITAFAAMHISSFINTGMGAKEPLHDPEDLT